MLVFSVVDYAEVRVVDVGGDIDALNADAFEHACSDSDGPRRVVVDLLACPYIDSTGLTALIKASKQKILTIVIQPASRVYRIFAITQLLSYFTIASTLSEATGHVTGSARSPGSPTASGSSASFA